MGDFDQCLSIDGTFQDDKFVGKYCLATVNLPKTELFKPLAINKSLLEHPWLFDTIELIHNNDNYYAMASGLCFPSICHQEEIRTILISCKLVALFVHYYNFFVDYEILNLFEFNVTYCQSREEPSPLDKKIWIAVYDVF